MASIKPRKSLNPAFLKIKPGRAAIELFKAKLIELLDLTDNNKSEEFHKNLLSEFLKRTGFEGRFFINTKDRNDLVIHTEHSPDTPVGVIIETKKPGNKTEMPREGQLNSKAVQELVLYFLRERITGKNNSVKYLIATDIHEWIIFDAQEFEREFAQNKDLVKQFKDFEEGRLSNSNTDHFYKEIARPILEKVQDSLEYTYFNIHEYEKALRNTDKADDRQLIVLFKLLSAEHLLKLPFANDSNSLNKNFYNELLHIIGLEQVSDKGKKLIQRKPEGKRDAASLLENTIAQLDTLNKISRLPNRSAYGNTEEEVHFNVALELCITWINRILFLKLLEAQLLAYHSGDRSYAFLNTARIKDYDKLNKLFFQVLARKTSERSPEINAEFGKIPYLNSSLFSDTELEQVCLFVSNLEDDMQLPIHSGTVLKDNTGKKRGGKLNAIDYLFEFLDAYDFSSEGKEEIEEDNKNLINASVLGLIFEKINGYRDGSFFTPGFITMYMCRETLRRAVVQKFNEAKGWNVADLGELYDKIEDRNEANALINSLHIVDPAVGSGHFLVSALNELIAIKHELRILQDRNGRRLKEYDIQVVNDELVVLDEEGRLFEYRPANPESQRVQETLFHEKQTLIENCLFGVDINPNSVKICQLRLWIELLKNAYYKTNSPSPVEKGPGGEVQLETLPNIDINIKCGNSLISRFELDADLSVALRKSKFTIDAYKVAVDTYRNAKNKAEKREMESLINAIKSDFRTEINKNDPKLKRLDRLSTELYHKYTSNQLFDTKLTKAQLKDRKTLEDEINKLSNDVEEIKSNRIFENAFEWRFEFPEVLNDEGAFVGFDVVIGNPPYIRQEEFKDIKDYLSNHYVTYSGTSDLYVYFVDLSFKLMKPEANFTFIMPNKWMQAGYGKNLRKLFLEQNLNEIIDFGDLQVFDEATTYPCILIASKEESKNDFNFTKVKELKTERFSYYVRSNSTKYDFNNLDSETWILTDSKEQMLLKKLKEKSKPLENYLNGSSFRGILTGLSEAFIIDQTTRDSLIQKHESSRELIKPFLLGRNIKPFASEENTHFLILIPKGFTIKRNIPQSKKNIVEEDFPRYGNMPFDEAWDWFKRNYPAIAEHLKPFKEKAEVRTDKGDFWWELRACDYYDQFVKPKILYQKFQVKPCFIYENTGKLCNDSMWMIPKNDVALVGLLNSKMGWYLISKYCTAIQNGYQLIWKYFGQIPIPVDFQDNNSEIKSKTLKIIDLKKQDPTADTTALEAEIDRMVYELYGLTEEEIALVEGSVH
ncbi:MAG: class I SAM-dependent DNA methyltransferase [Cytophagaceae bacterium]|nr:class I SAM-dependent DNA methyltransferase [Cytophagaceae bacterium]MBL0300726.1 class I SAM-dependent DNA methyltransferase [Cytophagaceae bacterium]MBL0327668.1 class I SAM-dependent DNA methyltransferase [Cytophagaceae bacterium]